MATGDVDLKTLLEHDFKMVQAIAGTSKLLVNELDASHYWVTQSISLFQRLGNICKNVGTLLDACEPYWADKATAFTKPEAVKLWKTAAGLWSALPGEQKRFEEYFFRNGLISAVYSDLSYKTYPNPAHNKIYIEIISTKSEMLELELVNIHGQLLYKRKINSFLNKEFELDISNYEAGIFLITMKSESQIVTKKLIKY